MLFPPEIIEFTQQRHFTQHSKPFRRIYFSVVIMVLAGLCLLPIIKVDVTTQSRGIIRTQTEPVLIQPVVSSLVTTMFVREGMKVQKGDTLIVLKTDNLQEQILQKEKQITDNHLFVNDLTQLINGKSGFNTSKYKLEWLQHKAKVDELNVNLKLKKKEFDLTSYLFGEKVVAEMDYLKQKNQYEAALSQLQFYKQQAKNSWQAELTRLEMEEKELESIIVRLEKEKLNYVLIAPVTGTVTQLAGIQGGSFVNPGNNLAQISPDEQLLAECYVSPADIGLIKIGQPVRLQLDAFNYNQWGLIEGAVTDISADIMSLNNKPVFKVRCNLLQSHLQLKSGHKGHLKKGMTFTGRFYLTQRTLFQLLFDKMDNWINPKNNQ
jgi:HlyD family secretion protein